MNASGCRPSIGLLVAALIAALPARVAAQQMDPNMQMPMAMPMPATKPAPKARPKPTAKKKAKAAPAAPQRSPGHARQAPPSSAEHSAGKSAPMDHSGMVMSMPMPDEPMQGMQHAPMPGMSMANEPRTPIPPLTDTDRAAAQAPTHEHAVHDNTIQHYTLIDRLETWQADKGRAVAWGGQTWIGTDLNRLWLRTEGKRINDHTDGADLEVLYGHSVATWWDVVAGGRHDFKPGASQDFAAIGVMGMVPYKFEVEATAYIGRHGQTAARLEVEYETLLTNRLILQPRLEANVYGQDDAARGIGSGLNTVEAGLRLRYEFTRRVAPYIGIEREQAFGNTADLRRDAGHPPHDTRLVAGVRIWF